LSKIVIIDYGLGNLKSVQHAFARHGVEAVISNAAGVVEEAAGLVLPGVGAFGRAMDNLERLKLTPLLKKKVGQGTPFLGICLGLQLLFEGSEEAPGRRGLSLLPGRVVRFQGDFKIPLIGWNQLEMQKENPLLAGDRGPSLFLFCPLLLCLASKPRPCPGPFLLREPVPGGGGAGNCYGLQFHPEKSSREGLKIIGNFGRLVKSCASNPGH
jgi:imidazole glycerol-phosphate synthase subunit HisH